MTNAPKNVHQRLAAAMAEVTYIQKEEKKGMNYRIVSHDAVTAKVRPALLKHGIVYYPVRCVPSHEGNRAACEMTVRFVNVDEPADFFDVPTFGYGIDPQDKGPGKAMSYAVKYALLKALGLETGDDPDHDDMPYEPPAKAQKAPPKAEPPLSQQAAAKEPQRDPKEIADALIGRLAKAMTKADLDATLGSPKVDAAWEWVAAQSPAEGERIRAAVEAARNRLDPIMAGEHRLDGVL